MELNYLVAKQYLC